MKFINDIGKRRAVEPRALSYPDSFTGQLFSFAKLFEVLQAIPSILEQGDSIKSSLQDNSPTEMSAKITIMAYTCQDFEARLASWRAQFDQENTMGREKPLYWEEPSMLYHSIPIDSPARVFPSFFCFPNLDIAQQLVLYWTSLLCMYLNQYGSEQAIQRRDSGLPSLYSTDAERAAVPAKCFELAIKVTQSLEYFVHPDMGLTAMDFLGFPANLVYGYLTMRGATEVFWFDVIFDRLTAMNPGFGEFMKAMAYQGGGGKAFRQLVLQQ